LTPGSDPLLLRELSLICKEPLGALFGNEYLRSPILSEDIPTLHKLKLYSFPLIPQLSVLRHLTTLDLYDPGPTANTLLNILANNTNLQKIGITGLLENQESPRGDLSITLPHLRNFQFYRCGAVDILRCLHLPRSDPFEIYIQLSFEGVHLPEAYQPYSSIQLTCDLKFHSIYLNVDSGFDLRVYDGSMGGLTTEFGELPPNTAEVLGPLTVQFIKYLRFWEDLLHQTFHPLRLLDPFHHMERLETLSLDYLPTSLEVIFFILDVEVIACPLLRTLMVELPEGEPAVMGKDPLLKAMCGRVSHGNVIWRLCVIVLSEEQVPLYSSIFDPFVQGIEVVVRQPELEDRGCWLVWGD
jgi:hypothetical protein